MSGSASAEPAARSTRGERFEQHFKTAQRDQSAVVPLRNNSAAVHVGGRGGKESPLAISGNPRKSDQDLPLEGEPAATALASTEAVDATTNKLPANLAISIDIVQNPAGDTDKKLVESTEADLTAEGDALSTMSTIGTEDAEAGVYAENADAEQVATTDVSSAGAGDQTIDAETVGATDQGQPLASSGESVVAEPSAAGISQGESLVADKASPEITAEPLAGIAPEPDIEASDKVATATADMGEEASVTNEGEMAFDPTLGMAGAAGNDAERAGQGGAGSASLSDASGGGRVTATMNPALGAAFAEQTVVDEQVTLRQPLDVAAVRETAARLDTEALIKQHLERDLPVRHSASDVTHRLSERLVLMVSRDIQQATIRLDPPELGKMDIQIRTQGDQVQVQVVAHQPMVRDLLEQQAFRLREMLEQQGFAKVDVNVSDQSQQDREQAQSRRNEFGGDADSGDAVEQPAQRRETVGLVDHYV